MAKDGRVERRQALIHPFPHRFRTSFPFETECMAMTFFFTLFLSHTRNLETECMALLAFAFHTSFQPSGLPMHTQRFFHSI
jgi:hypothetical protein